MTIAVPSGEHTTQQSRLGSWVEAHQESSRGGRAYRLLLNHRTHQAIALSETEEAVCRELAAGHCPDDGPGTAAFLQELCDQGFLAVSPPAPAERHALRLSLTRLDLSWTGADRFVHALHRRGAGHLFHPAAVVAQIVLAIAGLAALATAASSCQAFQLRVHPVQVPVVLGLSLAAIGVHEFAHALVVVHHRRTVDSAGLRLHLGTPAFYVESASTLLLPRRYRLIQAGAGVWAEWQFTSLVALWLWLDPGTSSAGLLHRFVLLNAATIATNLLPFTGLDGAWLLADALGVPDLALRSRGAFTRLLIAKASAEPVGPGDLALAGYGMLNGVTATGLLAASGFFWYQLFGGVAAVLLHHGPAGWLILAGAVAVMAMPALTAAVPALHAAARATGQLRAAVMFRWQWRWRIPATHRLQAALAWGTPNSIQLGTIAGHLERTRAGRSVPARLAVPCYGIVCAGTVTAVTRHGEHVTLTAGSTWDPAAQLETCRRATLIHISAAALHQVLAVG
jgi:hypothetical protein